ncbi:MAG: 2OG-Fe(II) oxygenase [Gammaproteobacteria bacterium]|nr:2OG-Fe(II) oxygenase [Gammaproteobacteria bacterium]
MTNALSDIVDLDRYPLHRQALRETCRQTLARDGALVLRRFLTPAAVETVRSEGEKNQHLAYFCSQEHNVYLMPPDAAFTHDHIRNRTVMSSKGCITDDQIPQASPLRRLYEAPPFRDFLCAVLGEVSLHAYADRLSSINLHYAEPGQELGWHFDNSSFATTLMIQEAEEGGVFEYVAAARDTQVGDHGFDNVRKVLDGEIQPQTLTMDAGALVLFRGRNALHRVTPVAGYRTRILVVLAYNAEPGICLSESARMTFYGRLQ